MLSKTRTLLLLTGQFAIAVGYMEIFPNGGTWWSALLILLIMFGFINGMLSASISR